MQLINIPFNNPVSHFLVALTDFIVRPTSRFTPKYKGINLSALLLAWLTQFILIAGIYKLQANNFSSDIATTTMALMLLAFVEIIKTTFHIVMVAIILLTIFA
jgi:YggT family protein